MRPGLPLARALLQADSLKTIEHVLVSLITLQVSGVLFKNGRLAIGAVLGVRWRSYWTFNLASMLLVEYIQGVPGQFLSRDRASCRAVTASSRSGLDQPAAT